MIYADFNATTPLGASAREWIEQAMNCWGNPSSAHQMGRKSRELLGKARDSVAAAAQVRSENVVFTSGGSEANTLSLLGYFWTAEKPFRLVTSEAEHSSLKGTVQHLREAGAEIAYVRLTPQGLVDLEHLQELLADKKTSLVSLMAANNETGVINPVQDILEICRKSDVLFHTDAVQAFGKISSQIWRDVPLVSISGHKIFAPKGIGALLVSPDLKLRPTHFGGAQEIKRRGGTENLIGAAGFGGAASDLANETDWARLDGLRNRLETSLKKELDDISFQGEGAKRLPNTTNVRFGGVLAEVLLTALDLDGVCISAGSACSSGSLTPSHVLTAMGLSAEQAQECVRVSWGKISTEADVDRVSELMVSHVRRIRARRKAN